MSSITLFTIQQCYHSPTSCQDFYTFSDDIKLFSRAFKTSKTLNFTNPSTFRLVDMLG